MIGNVGAEVLADKAQLLVCGCPFPYLWPCVVVLSPNGVCPQDVLFGPTIDAPPAAAAVVTAPPPLPPPMNTRSLHLILEGLGDGSISSLEEIGMEMHEHPDLVASRNKFHYEMGKYQRENWFHCPVCKERSYETKSVDAAGTECTKCRKSRHSNPGRIAVYSKDNDGDPLPKDLHKTLPALTVNCTNSCCDEMLSIARRFDSVQRICDQSSETQHH